MAKKQYISNTITRTARPRSKRLRELGSAAGGGSTVVINGSSSTGGTSTPAEPCHTHDNKSDLDRLSLDAALYLLVSKLQADTDGIVEAIKEKVKAGYADVAGTLSEVSPVWQWVLDEIAARALSKVNDDSAAGLITLQKGLRSLDDIKVGSSVVDSMVAGSGTLITDQKIQTPRLEVRESAVFNELLYNRIQAQESDFVFSAAGTVQAVEELGDDNYRLTIRKRWENDFTALTEHDVIYGSVNNLDTTGEYYNAWMRVVSVNTTANTIVVVTYPDHEVPGGVNYAPTELMVLCQRGNPVNPDRQSYWYISSREKCICMIDGITKPILEEHNYACIMGKLKELSIFDNLPINYKQSYLYVRGIAVQDIYMVDYLGVPTRTARHRENWVSNPDPEYTSTATLYDVVYHYGCEWMCLIDGTTDEPMYGCQGWAMIKGNPNFEIDVDSDMGFNVDYPASEDVVVDTLHVTGKIYNRDVTAYLDDANIVWTRDSGDVTEDNAWAVRRQDAGKTLELKRDDLGLNYTTIGYCKYRVVALLEDGKTDAMEIDL